MSTTAIIPTGNVEVKTHNAGQCQVCGVAHQKEFTVTLFEAVDQTGLVLGRCETFGNYGHFLQEAAANKTPVLLDSFETTKWGVAKVRIAKQQTGTTPQQPPKPQQEHPAPSPAAHLPDAGDFILMNKFLVHEFFEYFKSFGVASEVALAEARSLVAQYWMACRDKTVQLRKPDKGALRQKLSEPGQAKTADQPKPEPVVEPYDDPDQLGREIAAATTEEEVMAHIVKIAKAKLRDIDRQGLMVMASDKLAQIRSAKQS